VALERVAQALPTSVATTTRRRVTERRQTHLARTLESLITSSTPSLGSIAQEMSGSGTETQRAWRILTRLDELVAVDSAVTKFEPRPPTEVLRSGHRTTAEHALCLASLARAAGIPAGLALDEAPRLVAICQLDGVWKVVVTGRVLGRLTPLPPAAAVGALEVITKPAENAKVPTMEPAWRFLSEFYAPTSAR